jgi:osmotically-inducible protein OsmY
VLKREPFLKANHIYVWTKNRVVALEGVVPNVLIRENAEFDARYVLGMEGANRVMVLFTPVRM